MSIVRSAERDSGLLSRSRSEEPDTPTAIDQGALPTNPDPGTHPEQDLSVHRDGT